MSIYVKAAMRYLVIIFVFLLQPASAFSQEEAVIREQPQLTVEKIEITGAIKTRASVILRRLSFSQGDGVDADIISANLQTLKNTYFFKNVAIYTRPGSERGRIIVEINIQERFFPSIYFKGGHQELDGWYLSPLAVRFDNLFGHGYHSGFTTYLGERKMGVNLFFANDKYLNPAWQYYVELFAGGNICPHYVDKTLYNQLIGISGALLYVTPAKAVPYLTLGVGVQNIFPQKHMTRYSEPDTIEYDLPPEIRRSSATVTSLRGSLILAKDTRDHTLYPTRGFWGRANLDLVAELDHSAYRYIQGVIDVRYYHTLHHRSVGAVRVKLASTDPATPFYDRFYLGGSYTVRGYDEYTLTPVGWGTQLALFNLEYRIPLSRSKYPNHRWTAAFFLDSGAIRQAGVDDVIRGYFSVGAGLRVRLPIVGLFRLDCGIPLAKKPIRFTTTSGNIF